MRLQLTLTEESNFFFSLQWSSWCLLCSCKRIYSCFHAIPLLYLRNIFECLLSDCTSHISIPHSHPSIAFLCFRFAFAFKCGNEQWIGRPLIFLDCSGGRLRAVMGFHFIPMTNRLLHSDILLFSPKYFNILKLFSSDIHNCFYNSFGCVYYFISWECNEFYLVGFSWITLKSDTFYAMGHFQCDISCIFLGFNMAY